MSTSLRHLIWFGAIIAAGCGGQAEPAASSGDVKPQLFSTVRCQDPTACDLTNGTGVYFEELGNAGIGPYQALITHFINNNGVSVSFQARVLDLTNTWVYTTGYVTSAVYNGQSYNVTAIGTNGGTYPYVTLKNAGGAINVWGYYFPYLTLNVSFSFPVKAEYALTFGPSGWSSANYDIGVGNSGHGTVDYKWDMQWRDLLTQGSTPQPYCKRAPSVDAGGNKVQNDDSVVFQAGFDVDPQTGRVGPSSTDVTMSCRYGAPATVYWWGYDYATDPWHFAAAIHMKRASYCGDGGFHTVSGTKIDVQDEAYIEGATSLAGITIKDTAVEAFWGPNGAICYNQPRRPDLKNYGVTEFGGSCGGNAVPRCDTWTSPPWYYMIYWAMWYAQYNNAQYNTHALADGVVAQ